MSVPTIGTDEFVLVAGTTGSGKSVAAEIYLAGYQYVVKLDSKGEVLERRAKNKPIWHGLTEGKDYTVIEHLAEIDEVKTDKIIYCPDPYTEANAEFYEALMSWVYRRGNTILWIDELMEVAPTTNTINVPSLKALYTRGRSRKSVIWACTQRPIDIPAICIANSQWFFIFDLPQPQDRKKLFDLSGCENFMELPGKHYFWLYHMGDADAIRARFNLPGNW